MKTRTAVLVLLLLGVSWYYAVCYWSTYPNGIPLEFYPFWNASRAILHHADPYSPQVTIQNQIALYGTTAETLGLENQQRFAYPVYAAIPLLPLGLLDFHTANNIAFWLFATFTALAVGWLRGKWNQGTVLYCLLTFSSYPVIYDIRSRQPTLLFFGLAVASLALLRSGRVVPAGMVAALSVGEPHLVFSVLLAALMWGLGNWPQRRGFVFAFVIFSTALGALSYALSPGWISSWISTLRAWSQYNQPSLVVSWLGNKTGVAVSILLLIGLIAVLWLHRRSELLFQVALSVTVIHLILPYANYNAVMLLIPVVGLPTALNSLRPVER